ncbi:hypothetical protein CAEBREN_16572 [Caenorhabditis brenneri]|uniref:TIL domain-containing protein n=1 Tax=Caenorhabditis brenneri TaxID=135651 RepID=G0N8X9_CAEBE|nr:hypothetical protein CAEBREN_16572 [Caenorhabditis brenneri]
MKPCIEICKFASCDCKKGFLRNSLGKCVKPRDCTPQTTKCAKNETLYECGTACEPTCEKPNPGGCIEVCLVNRCQCSKGFVRHGLNCIAKKNCPK